MIKKKKQRVGGENKGWLLFNIREFYWTIAVVCLLFLSRDLLKFFWQKIKRNTFVWWFLWVHFVLCDSKYFLLSPKNKKKHTYTKKIYYPSCLFFFFFLHFPFSSAKKQYRLTCWCVPKDLDPRTSVRFLT